MPKLFLHFTVLLRFAIQLPVKHHCLCPVYKLKDYQSVAKSKPNILIDCFINHDKSHWGNEV